MRLSIFEKQVIIQEAMRCFGANSKVVLFGSRTKDDIKGGDIDLLIIPENRDSNYYNKINFLASVKARIGDQKIDLILEHIDDERSIIRTAKKEGIQL